MHKGEGGQNGEVVIVLISLKWIFIREDSILDHFGPKNLRTGENPLP
jgi:hypothetical protein